MFTWKPPSHLLMASPGKEFSIMRHIRIIALVLAASFLLPGFERDAGAADDTIYIIANNSFKASQISLGDVKRIFRKELSMVSGNRVAPINTTRANPLRAAFVKKVFGMSVSDEIAFWEKQKVMTGSQPPTEVDNTLKAVFSLKNGISYCFKSQYKPGTAKILLTL